MDELTREQEEAVAATVGAIQRIAMAIVELLPDLLPNLPSFIRRVCSGYALVWGVLRTQSV